MKAALLTRWEEGYELKEQGEIFFDSDRKRMSMVFRRKRPNLEETWAFMKGSPGIVLNLCTHVLMGDKRIPLTEEIRQQIIDNNCQLASKAFRVLGIPQRELSNDLPGHL